MHYRLWIALTLGLALPIDAQRADRDPGRRGALEQRFRDRLAAVMRERLNLNDEQMRRLGEVNQRFERDRREVFGDEMRVRHAMRQALAPNATVSQDSVEILVDRSLRLERRKIDLLENEQRELAQFLTPVQRARYLGMQEQLRRQMEEMRERRSDGDSGLRPGPRRPRRPE